MSQLVSACAGVALVEHLSAQGAASADVSTHGDYGGCPALIRFAHGLDKLGAGEHDCLRRSVQTRMHCMFQSPATGKRCVNWPPTCVILAYFISFVNI